MRLYSLIIQGWHTDTYKELLVLALPLLQPVRQTITGEEKLPVGGRIFMSMSSQTCFRCSLFLKSLWTGFRSKYVIPHHLFNIFLTITHPSQFRYRQKVNKHTFPIHASSRGSRTGHYSNKITLTIFHFTCEA